MAVALLEEDKTAQPELSYFSATAGGRRITRTSEISGDGYQDMFIPRFG